LGLKNILNPFLEAAWKAYIIFSSVCVSCLLLARGKKKGERIVFYTILNHQPSVVIHRTKKVRTKMLKDNLNMQNMQG
jgi:hypothetical protein